MQTLASEHSFNMGISPANVIVPTTRNYLLLLVLILQTYHSSLTLLASAAYDRSSDFCSTVATMFSNMSQRTPRSHRKVKPRPTASRTLTRLSTARRMSVKASRTLPTRGQSLPRHAPKHRVSSNRTHLSQICEFRIAVKKMRQRRSIGQVRSKVGLRLHFLP